jgi:hypothetical protein
MRALGSLEKEFTQVTGEEKEKPGVGKFHPNPDIENCHCERSEAISPFAMRLPRTFSRF